MRINDRIFFPDADDMQWSFDGVGKPWLNLDTSGNPDKSWATRVDLDPFPAYTHDQELVLAEARHCENLIPLPIPPRYFVLPREFTDRTNGRASLNVTYVDPPQWEKREPRPWIFLSGKRIPIHPAMTRYLVAHEYGHIVHGFLTKAMGFADDNEFEKMYAKDVRCSSWNGGYGGGRWHANTGEIIANDIRVAVLQREPEFWPHDCVHPDDAPPIAAWWKAKIEQHFLNVPKAA